MFCCLGYLSFQLQKFGLFSIKENKFDIFLVSRLFKFFKDQRIANIKKPKPIDIALLSHFYNSITDDLIFRQVAPTTVLNVTEDMLLHDFKGIFSWIRYDNKVLVWIN